MSIRDRGLRPYEGVRTGAGSRWLVVAERGLRDAWRAKAVKRVATLGAMLTAAWAVGMFIVSESGSVMQQVGDGAAQAVQKSPEWHLYYWTTFFWAGGPLLAVLLSIVVGAGAIADDARGGAMPFYLSRPLTLGGYLAGKLSPVVALAVGAVVVPGTLFVIESFALGGGAEAGRHLTMLGRVIAVGLVDGIVLAAPMVAVSAAVPKRSAAQAAGAALILVPAIAGWTVAKTARTQWALLLSIPAQIDAFGAWVFGVPLAEADRPLPAWAAAAMLAAVAVGSIVWLRVRMRALAEASS